MEARMSALMKEMKTLMTSLRDDEEGAAMIEYSILIGLITVVIIVSVGLVGDWVGASWEVLVEELGDAPGG
jgi:pilus assembly protein Flp/PilA